jgi:signal transduction histidine kinase
MKPISKIEHIAAPPFYPGDLFSKQEDNIYQRHQRGAWVRSGASLFMWFFAIIGFWMGTLDFFSYAGISFSVLFLVLINPPSLWILRRLRGKGHLEWVSLSINILEVLGYTAVIYFAGGLGRSYLTLIYSALIAYVGVLSPGYWPYILAAFCSLTFTGMITLEYIRFIPKTINSVMVNWPFAHQILDAIITGSLLFVTAFISSSTSRALNISKDQLREQNRALKAAMEKAQDSERIKSEFLANVSHEIRTPLNHIIGFSELLQDEHFGRLNPTQGEYLRDIINSSHHLLSLITNILDLSKIEAHKMKLERSEIHLQFLLEDSLSIVREKAFKQGLGLRTHFIDLPPTIQADEQKLKQVLYNLLSNAVKFTPDGGTVCLAAEQVRGSEFGDRETKETGPSPLSQEVKINGSFIQFSVTDTGIGVKEKDLERIFEPFEQADNSTSRRYQGTGLGLSLCKHMVELHGGRIWAESRGKDRGSGFHFTLPLLREEIGTRQ